MDIHQCIGWNMRRLRAERGLTQEDFATDAGFDRGYNSGIERGVRNVSVHNLGRVAAAFGVKPADLLDEDKALAFQKASRRK